MVRWQSQLDEWSFCIVWSYSLFLSLTPSPPPSPSVSSLSFCSSAFLLPYFLFLSASKQQNPNWVALPGQKAQWVCQTPWFLSSWAPQTHIWLSLPHGEYLSTLFCHTALTRLSFRKRSPLSIWVRHQAWWFESCSPQILMSYNNPFSFFFPGDWLTIQILSIVLVSYINHVSITLLLNNEQIRRSSVTTQGAHRKIWPYMIFSIVPKRCYNYKVEQFWFVLVPWDTVNLTFDGKFLKAQWCADSWWYEQWHAVYPCMWRVPEA